MILFDLDQPEAAHGFPQLAVASGSVKLSIPKRPTLMRYLREAQSAVGLKGEVCVLLTTDEGIRGLNRRFRKKNKATDVLSFPAEPGFGVAGDLAVSVETAARQAGEHAHRLSVELRVLMLHGLLHLAGYDHEADQGEMARKERRLRAKLGLPLGLIERVEADGKSIPSGAKAPIPSAGSMARLKPRPFKAKAESIKTTAELVGVARTGRKLASGAKALDSSSRKMYGLKPVPSIGPSLSSIKPSTSSVEPSWSLRAKARGVAR